MASADDIAGNVGRVRERMAAACARAGRREAEVRLLAVTKTVAPEVVLAATAAGLTLFGENRVQECEAKRAALGAQAAAWEWHLIGHLQSNKAARALALFSAIESLDSQELAQRLDRLAGAAGRRMPVMVEVNSAGEGQKSGVTPEAIEGLAATLATAAHLEWIGLMAIPPAAEDPGGSRPYFQKLHRLWEQWRPGASGARWELSMGMSHDFEVAIEEGATLVRVGTALFGRRD